MNNHTLTTYGSKSYMIRTKDFINRLTTKDKPFIVSDWFSQGFNLELERFTK